MLYQYDFMIYNNSVITETIKKIPNKMTYVCTRVLLYFLWCNKKIYIFLNSLINLVLNIFYQLNFMINLLQYFICL